MPPQFNLSPYPVSCSISCPRPPIKVLRVCLRLSSRPRFFSATAGGESASRPVQVAGRDCFWQPEDGGPHQLIAYQLGTVLGSLIFAP